MNKNPIENIRHSLAHLLGAAVLDLHPGSKLAIGPSIDDGFYYDIDVQGVISDNDLPKIEKRMRELLQTWKTFEGHEVTALEAKEIFKDNPYKNEIIDELADKGEKITLYTSGNFTDLCRGGHVESARDIKPDIFKLSRVAGAYWRGSEKNPQLTRIYGLAFATKDELQKHLTMLEEAKKRDHKVLGPQLEIFMFHHTAPGMPYWLPKGVILYNELVNFWRKEHAEREYQEIVSPLLNKKELYVTSGHYDHYWDDMFVVKTPDGEEYGLKAMNCPNAMTVFGMRPRSYRELPFRLSDTDTLHRNELSGTLNGLLRVREFRQDDAHIFVTEDQIEDEYRRVFDIVERFYSIFNMPYWFRLSTRPESFLGDPQTWDKAEKILHKILEQSGKTFVSGHGEGAFYGPKADILMKDALGREWQMGTVQLDFQQPKRFNLEYIDSDGKTKTPVAIHRVVYGSLERFIGILIEHYAGAFPVWLSPVQATILPISDNQNDWAEKVYGELKAEGIRVEINKNNETLGKKIRAAEMQKIPYLLVIGEKEIEAKSIAIRKRGQGDIGQMKIEKFLEKIKEEIYTKK